MPITNKITIPSRSMYLQVNSISFFLQRAALMGLYLAFFLVQFSCITGPYKTFVAATISYSKEPAKGKVVVAKKDHSKKSNIRLNKRFQPGITDDFHTINTDSPVKYIQNDKPVKPAEYLFFSFILATSLRGPPVMS